MYDINWNDKRTRDLLTEMAKASKKRHEAEMIRRKKYENTFHKKGISVLPRKSTSGQNLFGKTYYESYRAIGSDIRPFLKHVKKLKERLTEEEMFARQLSDKDIIIKE